MSQADLNLPLSLLKVDSGPLTEFKYFNKLAPEMRNSIYKLLLIPSTPVRINGYRSNRRTSQKPPLKATFRNLLEVNKQINSEVQPIFFSINTFFIEGQASYGAEHWNYLNRFLAFANTTPLEMRVHIRDLHFEIGLTPEVPSPRGYSEDYVFENNLRDVRAICRALPTCFPRLESLNVELRIRSPCNLRTCFSYFTLRENTDVIVDLFLPLQTMPKLEELVWDAIPSIDLSWIADRLSGEDTRYVVFDGGKRKRTSFNVEG